MAVPKVDQIKRMIQEDLQTHDPQKIKNPALKRLAENADTSKPDVHQAYDRMHHRHNRG